ncbi:MAG: glycosyltransferase [Anaerolineae bacterium]|uniref:glycosyltransferase n=1 Tax=Candidatus Amarolinea dominans TaxID=3140696 RepID=UPI00313483EC|nr:glycosyltransferase [Anaerolineae bacterium]
MSVAIVHDWLNQVGGAENVLEALTQFWPRPPIYTSIYWSALARQRPAFATWDIHTSFMQRLPGVFTHHQTYLPLYPLAFEQFDLSRYELVVSNKSGFCHGVITGPETLHLCYCLTPTRFIWNFDSYAQREGGLSRLANLALRPMLSYFRLWDRLAADRVDHFIAISRAVQRRLEKYYGRASTIIYPPVDTERFVPSGRPPGDYYLAGGRLIPYKRVDLAVRAFTQLGLPLLVYGEGRDLDSLRAIAGPNVTFLGRVSWARLVELFQNCRAFIFPGLEDFGIAPLEAQACGRPVIAFAGGGSFDTVVDGETGILFSEPRVESLQAAVRRFESLTLDPDQIRRHAERFSAARFRRDMETIIAQKLDAHRAALRQATRPLRDAAP